MAGMKAGKGGIIANPNCSTIIALMAVTPLHRAGERAALTACSWGWLSALLPGGLQCCCTACEPLLQRWRKMHGSVHLPASSARLAVTFSCPRPLLLNPCAAKVKRMVVSTYQAASGAGQAAMEELEQQTREVLEGEQPYAASV